MQHDFPSIFVKLARGYDHTSPRAVQGFSSLHPIMRIKGWLDRRLEARTRVRIPATLTANGVNQAVIISDISRSGAGLTKTSGLNVGDQVTIDIAGEYARQGKIVWTSKDSAGVLLDK